MNGKHTKHHHALKGIIHSEKGEHVGLKKKIFNKTSKNPFLLSFVVKNPHFLKDALLFHKSLQIKLF